MTALPSTAPVAVIGAGTMGGGIAQVAAAAGHPVLLFDTVEGAAEQAVARTVKGLEKLVARGKMSADDRDALVARITPVSSFAEMKPAKLVIEAIVENLDIKRGLFKDLQDLLDDDAILATNTSSLSVTAIAATLDDPSRLVGMHFFNPAPVMKLVEVVRGMATDASVVDTTFDTATFWKKSPVHAKSTPGFIVNRVARPFYGEALRILQEQAATPATIDAIMTGAGGFRMGPFALMDLIGLDVNYAVTCSVFDAFYQDARYLPSLIQKEMVDGGFFGRKSGQGFFDYRDGATPPVPDTAEAAPAPKRVVIEGHMGPAEALAERIVASGIPCSSVDGDGRIVLDDAVLMLTDGRTATARSCIETGPIVLFDLALDYTTASRIAVTKADQTAQPALIAACGLFQALGLDVSVVDDIAGMIATRTVAMLANEGAEAVSHGVATADGVDTAMMKGVNYPAGPLAWADAIGAAHVMGVLDTLAAHYGEDRYRASPLLRRLVANGGRFHD